MKIVCGICVVGSILIAIQELSYVGRSGIALVILGLAIITGLLSYAIYNVYDKKR